MEVCLAVLYPHAGHKAVIGQTQQLVTWLLLSVDSVLLRPSGTKGIRVHALLVQRGPLPDAVQTIRVKNPNTPPATEPGQDQGGEDTVPADFLDGSTVLAPLAADADPEAMQPEEEYVELAPEDDTEATNAVRARSRAPRVALGVSVAQGSVRRRLCSSHAPRIMICGSRQRVMLQLACRLPLLVVIGTGVRACSALDGSVFAVVAQPGKKRSGLHQGDRHVVGEDSQFGDIRHRPYGCGWQCCKHPWAWAEG